MQFYANEGKKVEIKVAERYYQRHAIKTHFIEPGEDYIQIFKHYVLPLYQPGDIVTCSEKIIALCQNRIIKEEELKVGFWAKLLSRFAAKTSAGVGVKEPRKMQYAIQLVGLPKVLWASFLSAITKLLGKKGVFYQVVGPEVSGLDGFYGHVWEQYAHIGICLPANPSKVCNEIQEKLGISCMIIDANDLGQEILGKSNDITLSDIELKQLIEDNPAGQGKEQTPLILIRPKEKSSLI